MNALIGDVPLRNLLSIWAPYCLQRRDDGAYVALNRQYRPIGCKERGNIETCPIAFFILGMTPQLAARLSFWKDTNMERIYLYNDACAPKNVKQMARYIARLVILAKQRVEYCDVAKLKAELNAAFRVVTLRVS